MDKTYFQNPNVKTVLALVPDKRCTPYVKRPTEEPTEEIEQRQSADTITSGDDVISKLTTTPDLKNLDTAGKAAVVKIFNHLQLAHNELSKFSGSIVSLGKVTSPDQFAFVLSLAIRPVIQLKLTPQLCLPAELKG